MSFIWPLLNLMVIMMFLSALMCFVLEFKHILSSLVCLEFVALTIFMALSTYCYILYMETFYSLIYISITACEAALGLSVTIVYVNKKGNEMFKNN